MTPKRRCLTAYAEAADLTLIFYEPPEVFDPAIVGVVYGFGQEPVVCYDQQRVLDGLCKDLGTDESAQEWFDVNTVGSYVGPATPRFLVRVKDLP